MVDALVSEFVVFYLDDGNIAGEYQYEYECELF